ncbi:MAG: Fic family protein [Candidatus Micrarchaeales archaeon]
MIDKSRSFSSYIGIIKPTKRESVRIENAFKERLIEKISGRKYSAVLLGKDDVVKVFLFRDLFNKKYLSLNNLGKRKYDIDSTISFTLTTLTTEEVDVSLEDVENAGKKGSNLTEKEKISKNMLDAVDSIRQKGQLDKRYLLELHRKIMATFENKAPGRLRNRQVYLRRKGEHSQNEGVEVRYSPPNYKRINKLLDSFLKWYNSSNLNPVEKAALAHYRLYMIHPFLDGNKRICRLIFNKILIDEGLPLINISIEKEGYFDALVASIEKGMPSVFVNFCLKQYYKQVREFLEHG